MKRKVNLWSSMALIALIPFANSCHDNAADTHPKEQEKSRFSIISLNQNDQLFYSWNLLKEHTGSIRGRNDNMISLENADLENVRKIVQEDETSLYTIELKDTTTIVNNNVILEEVEGGYYVSILEYIPKTFGSLVDPDKFTGTVNRYNIGGELITSTEVENGETKTSVNARGIGPIGQCVVGVKIIWDTSPEFTHYHGNGVGEWVIHIDYGPCASGYSEGAPDVSTVPLPIFGSYIPYDEYTAITSGGGDGSGPSDPFGDGPGRGDGSPSNVFGAIAFGGDIEMLNDMNAMVANWNVPMQTISQWQTTMKFLYKTCIGKRLINLLRAAGGSSRWIQEVKINPSLAHPGAYDRNTRIVYFKSADIQPIVIIEEMFHAYQHYNLGSQFTLTKKMNFEFEAKLFGTIIANWKVSSNDTNTVGMPSVTGTFDGFFQWIDGKTNEFTVWPTWSVLQNDYYDKLEEFVNNSSNLYNNSTQMDKTYKPKTLFDIKAGCN
ncbi:hypothetical protein QQ008_07625 [Fulvivirgaceae bacterium BMA10]|uniref:Lipoprotein n=1 Tax=Splendidivirga corallicola TaxID=3051826 RepID=A0ABT8KNV2_9BACT|nr:hypothetical protein [Fulvivirgaceae bacterium BMA10]